MVFSNFPLLPLGRKGKYKGISTLHTGRAMSDVQLSGWELPHETSQDWLCPQMGHVKLLYTFQLTN